MPEHSDGNCMRLQHLQSLYRLSMIVRSAANRMIVSCESCGNILPNIPCNSPNCLKHRSTQCPQPAQQEPHRRCLQLRQLQPGRNGSPRRLAPNRLSLGLGASLRYSLHWCPFEMFKLLFKYNRFQMDLCKGF